MKRFMIGDNPTVYVLPAMNEVPLKDVILFNTQAADMGLKVNWHDIEEAAQQMAVLDLVDPEGEAPDHPLNHEVLAASLWAARRRAGEDVTLSDATDIRVSDLRWLPDPEDRKPGKSKAAKKGRRTSGLAAVRRAAG